MYYHFTSSYRLNLDQYLSSSTSDIFLDPKLEVKSEPEIKIDPAFLLEQDLDQDEKQENVPQQDQDLTRNMKHEHQLEDHSVQSETSEPEPASDIPVTNSGGPETQASETAASTFTSEHDTLESRTEKLSQDIQEAVHSMKVRKKKCYVCPNTNPHCVACQKKIDSIWKKLFKNKSDFVSVEFPETAVDEALARARQSIYGLVPVPVSGENHSN